MAPKIDSFLSHRSSKIPVANSAKPLLARGKWSRTWRRSLLLSSICPLTLNIWLKRGENLLNWKKIIKMRKWMLIWISLEMKTRRTKLMPFCLLPRHRSLAAPLAGKLNPIHHPVTSIYMRYVIVQQPRCPLDGLQRRTTGGRRGICLTGKYCLLVRHSPGLHQAADSCCRGMYAGNEGLLG